MAHNPREPEKIRVTFNDAGIVGGVPLNDFRLHEFRRPKIGECSVFHGGMRENLVFHHWPLNVTPIHLARNYPPPPYCANLVLRIFADDHSDLYQPDMMEANHEDFFVDEFLSSVVTMEEHVFLARELSKF